MIERNVTWRTHVIFTPQLNYIIRTGNGIFSRLLNNKELSVCCSARVKICGYVSSGKLLVSTRFQNIQGGKQDKQVRGKL